MNTLSIRAENRTVGSDQLRSRRKCAHQSHNYRTMLLLLECADCRCCGRQALLYIGSLENDRVPRLLPESCLGIGRLWQAGARDSIRHAINPAVQEWIL